MHCHVIAFHYIDVIMTMMASQITSLTVVYSTVYSDVDQWKHQSSASLTFVWGIHWDRWIPRTKGQLRGKCFHLMTSSCKCFASNNWTLWVSVIPWLPSQEWYGVMACYRAVSAIGSPPEDHCRELLYSSLITRFMGLLLEIWRYSFNLFSDYNI